VKLRASADPPADIGDHTFPARKFVMAADLLVADGVLSRDRVLDFPPGQAMRNIINC